MNTPNSLIERKIEEFDKIWDLGLGILFDDGAGSYGKYSLVQKEIKSFIKQSLLEATQQAKREVLEEIDKEINVELNYAVVNIGYENGIKKALQIIKNKHFEQDVDKWYEDNKDLNEV